MTAKLTTVTPELEARMAEIREKWLAIGLATGPADRKTAEAGVDMTYCAAGLDEICLRTF